MKTLIAIAFGLAVFLSWPVAPAQSAPSGETGIGTNYAWTFGPPGCVHVRSRRSRETRYAGAPRCRRIYT